MYSHIIPQAFDEKIGNLERDKEYFKDYQDKVNEIQEKINTLKRAQKILNEKC